MARGGGASGGVGAVDIRGGISGGWQVWERDWLQRRWGKGAFRHLMVELRLEDEESYRKYMRMDTVICGKNFFHIVMTSTILGRELILDLKYIK